MAQACRLYVAHGWFCWVESLLTATWCDGPLLLHSRSPGCLIQSWPQWCFNIWCTEDGSIKLVQAQLYLCSEPVSFGAGGHCEPSQNTSTPCSLMISAFWRFGHAAYQCWASGSAANDGWRLAQHIDMIPVSSSNLAPTCGMRATQHTQMAQLVFNASHSCFSDVKRFVPQNSVCTDRWGQTRKFGKSTEPCVVAQLSTVLSVRSGPQCCWSLSLPSPLVVGPASHELRRSFRHKGSAKLGRMRTRRPNAGPWLRKEQKNGGGQVSAVQFSLRGSQRRSQQRSFRLTSWVWCMTSTIRKQWRVYFQQRRAHLSAEAWLTFWQQLQFPVGTTLSSVALFSCFRDCFTPSAVICSMARHVLDGWTSVSDPLLQLACEVFTVHSSLRQNRERFTAYPVKRASGTRQSGQSRSDGKCTRPSVGTFPE